MKLIKTCRYHLAKAKIDLTACQYIDAIEHHEFENAHELYKQGVHYCELLSIISNKRISFNRVITKTGA